MRTQLPTTRNLLEASFSGADAERLAERLKALADPVRLHIISMISQSATGEVCACELPLAVGKTQATVSHHLSLLVSTGFLEREQRGKWAWFRLCQDRLAEVRNAL